VREPSREDKTAAEEATDALKTLLARIGEIFGVFDLSFFVAGSVCFGALLFGARLFGVWTSFGDLKLVEWNAVHVGAVIVTCYVLGLVCFAAGRGGRSDEEFYQKLDRHLWTFRLREHYDLFLVERAGDDKTRLYKRLYTLLWAEVRQKRALAPSFNLLTRYWILAAMCDGLYAAFAAWGILWWVWRFPWLNGPPPPAWGWWFGGLAALWGAAYLCRGEARRYGDYQMYEICATLAYEHGHQQPGAIGTATATAAVSPAPLSRFAPLGEGAPPRIT
jgi:hypothetical protein